MISQWLVIAQRLIYNACISSDFAVSYLFGLSFVLINNHLNYPHSMTAVDAKNRSGKDFYISYYLTQLEKPDSGAGSSSDINRCCNPNCGCSTSKNGSKKLRPEMNDNKDTTETRISHGAPLYSLTDRNQTLKWACLSLSPTNIAHVMDVIAILVTVKFGQTDQYILCINISLCRVFL